jgi:site-specific recombinase XerD
LEVSGVVYLKNPDEVFSAFLKEKQFLEGVTPATIRIYSKSWLAFKAHKAELSESGVKNFVISMIEAGLKPSSANCYARCLNSFLTWLFENGYTETHLKIPYQKTPEKVLKTYTTEEIIKIVTHRSNTRSEKRILAILFLLIDTGCRINEALTLTRKNIDFDNLLVTLKGKGNKERKVPISLECRKVLFRWMQTHDHDLVFCSTSGRKIRYDNIRRDFIKLLESAGVEKSEGAFHAFRRYFGKHYIRNGGNLLYLQKIFGHSSLEMTRRYVEADEEDLQMAHKILSPLERLKRNR